MTNREDEYDYLFKGECVYDTLLGHYHFVSVVIST